MVLPWLAKYLDHYRPLLAGNRYRGGRVWVSMHYRALWRGTIYQKMMWLTEKAFGRGLSPHLFRDCLATSLAIHDPAQRRNRSTCSPTYLPVVEPPFLGRCRPYFKVTPPRVVDRPDPADGLAGLCRLPRCHDAQNGHLEDRQGPPYYACSSCARQGRTGCRGRAIRMELDTLLTTHLLDRLLHRERLAERLIRADERLRKAASAIEDTDRPDIKALKEAMDEADTALAAANELAAGRNAYLRHLEKLAAELSAEIARLDQLEQETGPMRELADAFTGHNDMKITLETFAIATMFDHVLEAANLRLGPMSRGRYTLIP